MNKESEAKNSKPNSSVLDTPRCNELLMICGLIVLAIGCGMLYALMEKNWAANSAIRERVLTVAGFLSISSFALCYFIIKAQQERKNRVPQVESNTELIYLMIDRPPSYDSVKEDPPPSYQTVIAGTYIIPCHKARL